MVLYRKYTGCGRQNDFNVYANRRLVAHLGIRVPDGAFMTLAGETAPWQVRKAPSWPRSWANFSRLSL